jgi:hypothetical protein
MSSRRTAVRIAIVTAVALAGCFVNLRPREADVRPLTLQVIDARTRAPLRGVEVVWSLQTTVQREHVALGCLPDIHPDIATKIAFEDEGVTDANGELTFRPGRVAFEGNEIVDMEYVFVNLRADPGAAWTQRERSLREAGCRAGEVYWRCRGPGHGAAETLRATIEPEAVRAAVLRNPHPGYLGAVVSNSPWPRPPGMGDRRETGDQLRWQSNFESLGKQPLRVVVALEPRAP